MGDGFTKFYLVERLQRTSKVWEIGAGTSEIMRLILYRFGMGKWSPISNVKRVIHPKLRVPIETSPEKAPKFAVSSPEEVEDRVLEALAENYRVNLGLCMTLNDLLESLEGVGAEDVSHALKSLERKGFARAYRDRRGE